MEGTDRRYAHRYSVRFPITFTINKTRGVRYGEILDVSPYGMRFSTRTQIFEGQVVEILLKVPLDVMGSPSPDWFWWGQVVHAKRAPAGEGIEVGVKFFAGDHAPVKPSELGRNEKSLL